MQTQFTYFKSNIKNLNPQEMKKFFAILFAGFLFVFLFSGVNSNTAFAIDSTNAVLEYCTGTWCGYCPCGHQIINQQILPLYPNTVIIGYHGTSSDPWYAYSQTMLSTFGFTAYPTGIISRQSGIQSRSAWLSYVAMYASMAPTLKIELSNKTYNGATRLLSANVAVTALQDLPAGQYNIYYVITEDNLIYAQNHYAACGYSGYINDYVHKHVCKYAVNAPYGDTITTQTWTNGQVKNIQAAITLPTHVVPENCALNVLVYKYGSPLSSGAAIQNGKHETVQNFTPTGIKNENTLTADKYALRQNYPNPFNPMTKIEFSIPQADYVSLKFYDILGNEVGSYLNNYYLTPGVYSAEFDGSKLSSGVYFYTLSSKNFTDTKKMLLVK